MQPYKGAYAPSFWTNGRGKTRSAFPRCSPVDKLVPGDVTCLCSKIVVLHRRAERVSHKHSMATREEERLARNGRSNDDAAGNGDTINDAFPAACLPAGPLHSTNLIARAKQGELMDRHGNQIDPASYDPYLNSYEQELEQEESSKEWRPFKALPRNMDPDPPALFIGRPGVPTVLLGCVSCFCMSVFALIVLIILFYLEDFGDLTVWMYGDRRYAPPPPAEL